MKTVTEFYVFLMEFIFCLKEAFLLLYAFLLNYSFTAELINDGTMAVTSIHLIRKKLPLFQVIYYPPTRKIILT